MDRNTQVFLRLAVSGYLIYLACQILTEQIAGRSAMNDVLAYVASAVMLLGGIAFIVYSILKYAASKDQNGKAGQGSGEEKEKGNAED